MASKTDSITLEGKTDKKKATRYSQNQFPRYSLEKALKIPHALKENFAGKPTDPINLAPACNYSPQSSMWRYLTGASVAYGLTVGASNSKEIGLTTLGERLVAPLKEGDDTIALREAAMFPSVLNEFYNKYNQNKFPKENIAKNVLNSMGVPSDRLNDAYNIIKENSSFANIIQSISGGDYVNIDSVIASSSRSHNTENNVDGEMSESSDQESELPSELLTRMAITSPDRNPDSRTPNPPTNPRVYISHGKNKNMLNQLKELLSYGQLEPVISVEREATAIPVPQKVFDEMRTCVACIIHIDIEELLNENGISTHMLNENVLIEIGAALAFYGKNVVLLCKKGVSLPSNLQGLYKCEYEGDQLDYNSTIKLLKTMQELRKSM